MLPVKLVPEVTALLQNVSLEILFTEGVGFTVIVNVVGLPVQLFDVPCTVIVAVTGVLPLLMAVKDGMEPLPVAANPIDGSLLVQL